MRNIILGVLFAFGSAGADVIECENGDRYNGKVLMVDETNVKVQNEIAGVLSIPRSKVSTITFGNPKIARPASAPVSQTNVLSRNQPLKFDSSSIEQVQNQLLGDAGPEATEMFQEMVRGLMSGKLELGDIRTKAQGTLDELKQLQKDLGDDDTAALLGSYASILENFLKQGPSPAAGAPVSKPSAATTTGKSE
jgi:hypothetical protein